MSPPRVPLLLANVAVFLRQVREGEGEEMKGSLHGRAVVNEKQVAWI